MSTSQFYIDQLLPLVGCTVVNVLSCPSDDGGDDFFGLAFKDADGKIHNLILLSDDEGNGPGSFEFLP